MGPNDDGVTIDNNVGAEFPDDFFNAVNSVDII